MPSDWIDTSLPKSEKKDWIAPLKTLDSIHQTRQEEAAKPKIDPIIPAPVPVEDIPYKSVATAVDAAAKSLLDASVGIKKSEVNLSKAMLGVTSIGEKGKEISDNVKKFKDKITSLYSEMESLSNEMGLYKAGLPVDSAKQD
jgi:hypothetical protein